MKQSPEQVQALADAMWQLLDDMGVEGTAVCGYAKAKARVAYEPFREEDENGDDGVDYPLADAEDVIADVDSRYGDHGRPSKSPLDRRAVRD